jgi:hypothetical protein
MYIRDKRKAASKVNAAVVVGHELKDIFKNVATHHLYPQGAKIVKDFCNNFGHFSVFI